MAKPKIIYYTHVYYLDLAVEYVKALSVLNYEVNVLIELTTERLKSNILDVDTNLNDFPDITSFNDVKQLWQIEFLEEYFKDCKTVNFCVYKPGRNIKSILQTTLSISLLIKSIDPHFIHFDDISPRQSFVLPLLLKLRCKYVLNIHDPKPHKGEFEAKRYLLKKLLNLIISKYVVFSEYSFNQVQSILSSNKQIFRLRLLPYTVFRHFSKTFTNKDNASSFLPISFIGRISPYKGVEMFIEAIKEVVNIFPDQKFIIAGKPIDNFFLSIPTELNSSIILYDRHISNQELVNIVESSRLVVCPYIEATQSGVVMTVRALNKSILVTNVGALAEYVVDGETGIILNEINSQMLAKSLIDHLSCDFFTSQLQNNFNRLETIEDQYYNASIVKKIYK